MVEDTSKIIIIVLVVLIVLTGGFLLFQRFSSKPNSKNLPVQNITTEEPKITEEVKGATSSAKVLPKTGGEVYFLVLLATSFLISGWGLSKFPK